MQYFLHSQILRNCTVNVYEGYAALFMTRSALDSSTFLTARRSQDEALDFIRLARVTWEDGINEELYAIVSEARRPFCIVRCGRRCVCVSIALNLELLGLAWLCAYVCMCISLSFCVYMYVCMYVCMHVCIY